MPTPNKQARPDSGVIMASQTKRSEKSPDYWGEIAVDIKNLTNVKVENGLYIFRLSGWKKTAASGKTYLSLAVDRFVPNEEPKQAPKRRDDDEEMPF